MHLWKKQKLFWQSWGLVYRRLIRNGYFAYFDVRYHSTCTSLQQTAFTKIHNSSIIYGSHICFKFLDRPQISGQCNLFRYNKTVLRSFCNIQFFHVFNKFSEVFFLLINVIFVFDTFCLLKKLIKKIYKYMFKRWSWKFWRNFKIKREHNMALFFSQVFKRTFCFGQMQIWCFAIHTNTRFNFIYCIVSVEIILFKKFLIKGTIKFYSKANYCK